MSQDLSSPSRVIPARSRTRAEATLSTSVTAHTRKMAGWPSPHSTTARAASVMNPCPHHGRPST